MIRCHQVTPKYQVYKVEKILKGSLVWIPSPSPSVKIQIMGGKVCLRCKGKTLLGDVKKLFVFKKVNFLANSLNFQTTMNGRKNWIYQQILKVFEISFSSQVISNLVLIRFGNILFAGNNFIKLYNQGKLPSFDHF